MIVIRKNRAFCLIFLVALVILCVYYVSFQAPTYKKTGIQCYHYNIPSLPPILRATPHRDTSIFFHETSCKSFECGKITISARQACAVESAAKLNPNFDVYLLYVSPGDINYEGEQSDKFLHALLTYENVHFHHLDFGDYLQGTPLESLWTQGTLEKSLFVESHASDLLRYMTLWRYGGIYLDLDVIVIKPLENLALNYAGVQDDEYVAAGVISFNTTGTGHVIANKCINDLAKNFNGNDWPNNGPGTITRVVKELCATNTVKDLGGSTCAGPFKVYPPEAFYPISWTEWNMYFDERYNDEVKRKTENSYIVHMWNKLSQDTKVPKDSNVSYALFAREFCPRVFKQCSHFF